jgi:RecJ-like exonuclease
MVKCVMCEQYFEPSPEAVKAWVESAAVFDPTDWECPACEEAYDNFLAAEQSAEQPCPACGGRGHYPVNGHEATCEWCQDTGHPDYTLLPRESRTDGSG